MVRKSTKPDLPKIGSRVRVHWGGVRPVEGQVLEVDDTAAHPYAIVAVYLDGVEDDSFTLAWPLDGVELLDAA